MLEKTCLEFIDALASGQPVPGGGGAAALCGALGMALGTMVCNLTLGKKKYADVQRDIERIVVEGEDLRRQLQALVNADAKAFEPLSQAYSLPKETAEQLAHRDAVMAKCLKDACQVPLRIMETCAKAIALHEDLAVKGSRIALSDVGVGASLCRTALESASLNIFINTKIMKDRDAALALESAADELLNEWLPRADKVVETVTASLRN